MAPHSSQEVKDSGCEGDWEQAVEDGGRLVAHISVAVCIEVVDRHDLEVEHERELGLVEVIVKLLSIRVHAFGEDNVAIFVRNMERAIVKAIWAKALLEHRVGLLPGAALRELLRRLVQLHFIRVDAVIVVVPPGKHGFADADDFYVVFRVVVGPLGLISVARQARQVFEALIMVPLALGRPEVDVPVELLDLPVLDSMAAPPPFRRVATEAAVPGPLFVIIRRNLGWPLYGMAILRHAIRTKRLVNLLVQRLVEVRSPDEVIFIVIIVRHVVHRISIPVVPYRWCLYLWRCH